MNNESLKAKFALARVIKGILALPERDRGNLDDPDTTAARISVVQRKRFLRNLYRDWYGMLTRSAEGTPEGPHVEVGSGPGFFRQVNARIVTSDVFYVPGVQGVFSAEALPFPDSSLAVIYLVDVLHHIPHPGRFFEEAQRCLKPGGRIIMIEPFNTWWGRFVWRNFHHEPFVLEAEWDLPGQGPLSDANGALPWIVFRRDRQHFVENFPSLKVTQLAPFMPVAYLLSGGVSLRALAPAWIYSSVRFFERSLGPANRVLGIFALIVVERK